jgi:uncharacterized protein (DUF2147 family)
MKKNGASSLLLLVVVLTFLSISSFTSSSNPDAVLGTWLTGSKKGHVQIYKENGKYYGKIVWLQEPLDPKTNKPKTDLNNPDSKKKTQPLVGLVNLRGFEFDGTTWEEGKIYDPENGKEYSCKIALKGTNTLDVRGYVGFSLMGRTDTWQRVK